MHVIVLLGAQNELDGTLTPMAIARAQGALGVWKRCPGARLLVTGGYGVFNRAPLPHAHYLAGYLRLQGVKQADLLPLAPSGNTVEDAWFARQILEPLGQPELTVVTSAHHVERARLVFECIFATQPIATVATPATVGPDELRRMIEHERAALAKIIAQGGVIVEGRFYPCRTI